MASESAAAVRGRSRSGWARIVLCLLAASVALAAGGRDESDPRAVRSKYVVSRTALSADVNGVDGSERVILMNRLTGAKRAEVALDVLIGVYAGEEGPLLWSHSVLAAYGGPCFAGEVALVDLESDGPREIVLTWATSEGPERWERRGAIFRWEGAGPVEVWSGVMRLDTTRDPETPSGERTAFRRELDYGKTLAARGRTLFFTKTVRVAAGVTLPEPRPISEKVPLPARGASR